MKTYRHERDPKRFDGWKGSNEYWVLEQGEHCQKRLVECSRELRKAAAEQIEALLSKIKATATDKLTALGEKTLKAEIDRLSRLVALAKRRVETA